jgi:hypothetical protein
MPDSAANVVPGPADGRSPDFVAAQSKFQTLDSRGGANALLRNGRLAVRLG